MWRQGANVLAIFSVSKIPQDNLFQKYLLWYRVVDRLLFLLPRVSWFLLRVTLDVCEDHIKLDISFHFVFASYTNPYKD